MGLQLATIKTVAILRLPVTVRRMVNETDAAVAVANQTFGKLIIHALFRMGVTHFIVSPGSRSTPLVAGVASLNNDATACVMLDERSAAFRALGCVKATRRPVALICTSGSAGAHYYPAMIEAREAGLPLLVLTADRPPELRHCHAGQTIDQQDLFGSYQVFAAELPVPGVDPLLLRQVRELCRRAVQAALGEPRGPVHLNCPFREPFSAPQTASADLEIEAVLSDLQPVQAIHADHGLLPDLPERTLILAGPRPTRDFSSEWEALVDLGWHRGFPILADGSNPLRYHAAESPHVIIHYDRMVRDPELWEKLKPDAVVMWGEPPTSKVLRERLRDLDVRGFLIGEGRMGINPIHGRIQSGGKSVTAFVERCRGQKGHYAEVWAHLDRRAEAGLQAALLQPHPLFEGDVHRLLGEILPAHAAVLFANSLAIRDADWFMPRRSEPLIPFSQRGANGIDGTLSLARGIAGGLQGPVWLVCGDLALLHDTNGLLGAATDRFGVCVVLINNQGGGIFEFLPQSSGPADAFDKFFATPQRVDFKLLAHAHGCVHRICEDLPSLRSGLTAWDQRGLLILEVPVDRKASREWHRRLLSAELLDSPSAGFPQAPA